jgi:hypothetical protein
MEILSKGKAESVRSVTRRRMRLPFFLSARILVTPGVYNRADHVAAHKRW